MLAIALPPPPPLIQIDPRPGQQSLPLVPVPRSTVPIRLRTCPRDVKVFCKQPIKIPPVVKPEGIQKNQMNQPSPERRVNPILLELLRQRVLQPE